MGVRLPHSARTVHVMPHADVIGHEVTEDCPCGPFAELCETADGPDGWIYVHHSLDGRELHERGAA